MKNNWKTKGISLFAAAVLAVGVFGMLSPSAGQQNNSKDTVVPTDRYATAAELKLMEGFPPPPDKQVTRGNALLTPPFNRWSYLHMRMFFPSAPIGAADHAVAVDKAIDQGIDGVKVKDPKTGGMVDMATFLRETYTDALVVIHGDKIVYEKFLNGMNANQPHQMMSVTKSFAGLLGLMAVQDGKLKETDPVTKYVPELKKSSAFADATFGQVLNMTNSMKFREDYADPRSGVRHYGAVLGWTDPVEGIEYEANLYDYLVTLPADPRFKNGEVFNYQTPKTDVVNWVTNRVTGQSFQDEMYKQLWSKLGTDGRTYVLLDRNATLVAGGGLNATTYNLARFAIMMINDGKFNGQQVVDPAIIQKIAKGGSIEAFDKGSESDGVVHLKGEWSYRAMWWVKHTPGSEAFMAIGINGQWIYLDPDRRIAIIKQASQPVSKDQTLNVADLNGFSAIVDYLSKK